MYSITRECGFDGVFVFLFLFVLQEQLKEQSRYYVLNYNTRFRVKLNLVAGIR